MSLQKPSPSPAELIASIQFLRRYHLGFGLDCDTGEVFRLPGNANDLKARASKALRELAEAAEVRGYDSSIISTIPADAGWNILDRLMARLTNECRPTRSTKAKPAPKLQRASWFDDKTDGFLNEDRLRKTGKRIGSVMKGGKGGKRGIRYYDIALVAKRWSEVADKLIDDAGNIRK